MLISIIIPTLNESAKIGTLIQNINELSGNKEIIVVDGGSFDGTDEIAKSLGINVIKTSPGRAFQMNLGASKSKGDILWFVHADSILSKSSLNDIEKSINIGAIGGFFKLYFYDNDNNRFLKFIERTSHTRAKRFGLIFGDQGLFIRRDIFNKYNGFAPVKLMEDWEFSRRIRRLHKNGLIHALDTFIGTSARRYIKNGIFKTWIKMNIIKMLYILGKSTEGLFNFYETDTR